MYKIYVYQLSKEENIWCEATLTSVFTFSHLNDAQATFHALNLVETVSLHPAGCYELGFSAQLVRVVDNPNGDFDTVSILETKRYTTDDHYCWCPF